MFRSSRSYSRSLLVLKSCPTNSIILALTAVVLSDCIVVSRYLQWYEIRIRSCKAQKKSNPSNPAIYLANIYDVATPVKDTPGPMESKQIHNWGNSIKLRCVTSEMALAQKVWTEFWTADWISSMHNCIQIRLFAFSCNLFCELCTRYLQNKEATEQHH